MTRLHVGGIQAEGGAEFVIRTAKGAGICVCQALHIDFTAEGLTVGVKASNEVADHGERRNRADHKNHQNQRSRAPEAWWASTSYISYHDITCEMMMSPAVRPI